MKYCVVVTLLTGLWAFAGEPSTSYRITGRIVDAIDRQAVPAAEVSLRQLGHRTKTDQNGFFAIEGITESQVRIRVQKRGYMDYEGPILALTQTMEPRTIEIAKIGQLLETMVVIPSLYSLLERNPTPNQYLTEDEIRVMPKFGDDIYRVVAAMPGTVSNNFSAKFSVRGGHEDENLVLIDGMEVYEPFHLKDFGSVFSAIDPDAIGRLDLMTGGYTAEYGDRMSGVLDMQTVVPSARKTSAAVSFSTAGLLTQGTFDGGSGHYLVTARRGYLDVVLAMVNADDDLKIPYFDSLGKIHYNFNANHSLTFQYFILDDEIDFSEQEDDEFGEVTTQYGGRYLWTTLTSFWTDRLLSKTMLYWGNVVRERYAFGENFDNQDEAFLDEDRDYDYDGIKQEWEYIPSERFMLKLGLEFKEQEANYIYATAFNRSDALIGPDREAFELDLNPKGETFSGYLTTRFAFSDRVVAELGLRYDRQSFLEDDQLSPRVNLSYQVQPQTSLRASVGRFHQTRGLHELQILDNDTEFYPAAYTDQALVSLQHTFANQLNLRVETYYKDVHDLPRRYDSIYDYLEPFPEWQDDRIAIDSDGAEAYGVEVSLKHGYDNGIAWMFHYAYARVEDEIDGVSTPRPWGQPHFVKAHLNWRKSAKWTSHLTWSYAPGWRTQTLQVRSVQNPDGSSGFRAEVGPLYQENLGAFHSLDFRLTRHFTRPNHKGLSFYLDLANVYDRETVLGYDYEVYSTPEGPVLSIDEDTSLPLLPSLGLTWVF